MESLERQSTASSTSKFDKLKLFLREIKYKFIILFAMSMVCIGDIVFNFLSKLQSSGKLESILNRYLERHNVHFKNITKEE